MKSFENFINENISQYNLGSQLELYMNKVIEQLRTVKAAEWPYHKKQDFLNRMYRELGMNSQQINKSSINIKNNQMSQQPQMTQQKPQGGI